MKYENGLNVSSVFIGLAVWLLGAGHGVSQDHLQLPSLSQDEPNLLKPFSEIGKTFQVGGSPTSPYQVVDASFSWETFGKRLYQSGPTSAFLSFDNVMTVLGPLVNGNLNQVLTVPVSTATAKSYGTKLFVSLGAEYLSSAFSSELILKVRVRRQDPATPGIFRNDDVNIYGGMHIVNRTSGTGYLFQDPLIGYFKKWNGGAYFYYTLFLPLDPAYFHWPIHEVQLIYNDPFPNSSLQKPNIHIRGLNIETNIQIQPFLSFSQSDPQWKSIRLNNWFNMATVGCVVTSAAMAMRAIGIQKGPDGSDITPGTLVNWLNANSGFAGKSPSLVWKSLTIFANAAKNNGYNNGISMSLTHYRQRADQNLDPTQKRLLLEGALASRYPVILRVASGYKTVDNDKNRDGHAVLAYGLVPDFASNISGTYQVNDPAGASSPPNLWRRTVGNSNWKGKWLFGVAAKPVSGSVVLPNDARIVLGSPGRIYIEGAVSGYKIGYADGVNFTNSFPSATYEFINPNQDFEPGVDNAPEPPPAEDIQVVNIRDRPNEPLNVKVVGTGTGPYTLNLDDWVWRNQNLEKVHSQEKAGTLSPGALVTATVPASGYGEPPVANDPPEMWWSFWHGSSVSTGGGNFQGGLNRKIFPVNTVLNVYGTDSTPNMESIRGTVTLQTLTLIKGFEEVTNLPGNTIKGKITLDRAGVWGGIFWGRDGAGNESSLYMDIYTGEFITINSQPVFQTKLEGENVSFSVSVTANPAPTYQWYKNGAAISGATGSTYSKSGLVPADFGQYHCHVKQFSGSQMMSEATS